MTKDGLSVSDARRLLSERFGIEFSDDVNSLDILKTRVKLTGAHHRLLEELVPSAGINNYDFVLSQKDLLRTHIENLTALASQNLPLDQLACEADELRYDIMSSFKRRKEGSWEDIGSLDQSISYAGTIERSQGTQYAGCDISVVAGENDLDKAGYYNTRGLDLLELLIKKEFDSKWCPNCLPKRKPGKK